MNTLSSKLTAFAAALAMNGLVFGALGYFFALQSQPNISAIAFAKAVVAHRVLG
jgi:predicted signal transduction protein with EAL and GGDEF domain